MPSVVQRVRALKADLDSVLRGRLESKDREVKLVARNLDLTGRPESKSGLFQKRG